MTVCSNGKIIVRCHGALNECLGSDIVRVGQVWRRFGIVKQIQIDQGACVDSGSDGCLTVDVPCCKARVFDVV